MHNRINFTKAGIEALVPPSEGRVYFYDQRTAAGRPARVKLGRYPDITIEEARRAATRISGEVAEGNDPQAARRQARKEWTLGQVWEHFRDNHAAVRLRPRTRETYSRQWDKHLLLWTGWRLSAITVAKVHALHAGMAESPYMANRVLALLSRLYGYARKPLGWQGSNPAASVERFPEETRERILDRQELPRFFAALDAEPDQTMKDYFMLLLLTGARRSALAAMQWEQVDLANAVWAIPRELAKNGKVQRVPLVDAAIEILKRREAFADGLTWVFPGRRRGKPIQETKGHWARLLRRAGLLDLRLHDLRRTLGSWQADTGASLPIIGKSLGHSSSQATQIYARLSLDPVRRAVRTATDAILRAGRNHDLISLNPTSHGAQKARLQLERIHSRLRDERIRLQRKREYWSPGTLRGDRALHDLLLSHGPELAISLRELPDTLRLLREDGRSFSEYLRHGDDRDIDFQSPVGARGPRLGRGLKELLGGRTLCKHQTITQRSYEIACATLSTIWRAHPLLFKPPVIFASCGDLMPSILDDLLRMYARPSYNPSEVCLCTLRIHEQALAIWIRETSHLTASSGRLPSGVSRLLHASLGTPDYELAQVMKDLLEHDATSCARPRRGRDIAAATQAGCRERHLVQRHLEFLIGRGFVESVRGPRGGYFLTPNGVRLAREIIRVRSRAAI